MRLYLFVVFTFLLTLEGSLCFSQVSVDPSDPSAVGYGKSKVDLHDNRWNFSASTSAVRGLDYYAKIYLSHSLAGVYKLSKAETLSLGMSYSQPADGKVTFTEDWGFEDVGLSYTRASFLKPTKKSSSSLRVGLSFPTARSSQRASKYGQLSFSLPTGLSWRGNSVVLIPGVGFSHYKYEEADLNGFQKNRPLSIPLNLVISRRLSRRISASISGGVVELADYSLNFIQVQSLGVSATAMLGKGFSLTGGYSWRDRRISNNSYFDDDSSRYFLSLSVYR